VRDGKGHERRGREGVSKAAGEKPAGVKAQEGIERKAGLNRLSAATDRCSDQRPEGGASGTGSGGATRREEKLGNGMRARLVDETSRLGSGENP
jgi:hypothetical protein